MKILVTENQLDKILREDDVLLNVIKEQLDVASDRNQLVVLQQKINDLISNKAKEKAILDGISLKITPGKSGYTLQIGKEAGPMQRMATGVYALILKAGGQLSAAGIPMSSLMGEIEKIPEYKSLAEKHPEIKAQIQNGQIQGRVYADDQNQGFFKFTRQRALTDKKEMKYAIPIGQEYPFGEFFDRNKVNFKFPDGTFGVLESGYLTADLVATQIRLSAPAAQQVSPTIQISPMEFQDTFNFNDVEFKDVNATGQQIQAFVQQIKGYIQKYGQPFIEHFKLANPTIYGYASVDGDPNQEIVGEYKPCSGNKTRKDYDLCLSTERAKKIAELLNQELPELGDVFQFKGMGETTKWGPGWTAQSPTIPEKTAPNRRYVLGPIKPFTVTVQPQANQPAPAQPAQVNRPAAVPQTGV